MKPMYPVFQSSEVAPRILQAISSLNQVGAAINRINQEEPVDIKEILERIVDGATRLIPGAAAVIYIFDTQHNAFDLASRLSAGEQTPSIPNDAPRLQGLGRRALQQKHRIISYEEAGTDIHPEIVRAGARVVACFPFIVSDQPVGVLYVYLFEERQFSQLEELLIENFVNLAAMAVYQASRLALVRHDLARKEEELFHLRRTGLLISSRLKLEETLESILQMALEVTNGKYGIFRLVDKSGQNLVARAIAGAELQQPQVNNLAVDEHSVMGWVCTNRQPALVYDLQAPPWAGIYYPLDADIQMRSELAVPLINAGGRVEGVLNLESPQVGAFSEQDSYLLQALAAQAVTAIQEARLLDALQEAAQMLITSSDQEVLARLVELACDLLNVSTANIWLRDGEWLTLQASHGAFQQERRLPLNNSLTGQAILTRTTIMTSDLRADERFYRPDLALAQDWRRALILPLAIGADQEPIGAFSVYGTSSDPGRFAESEWDKKMLTCLAHYAVLAIKNAGNLEALRLAQEQHALAETFAAVGDIAANLLHQLNNKIGTIPVRIQGVQDKCERVLSEDIYLASNLTEIERSASEAMTAVRENLSYLRPIHLAEVDVAHCIKTALESTHLPEGVKIQCHNLEDLPPVMTGQHNLDLVFANLLGNAAEAMKGQGQITIRGMVQDRMVEIALGDSGPGIPPELHTKVFELNYSGRSQNRPGKLGFGLWWVKTVMARLGGSVTVESDGLQGTTFHLRLPVAEKKA